jgi:hypothetical protein
VLLVSRRQPPPLTVRISGNLRAQIDAAAQRAGMSRNGWVVWALGQAVNGEPASPVGETESGPPVPHDVEGWTDGKPTSERPAARIEQTGS